MSTSDKNSHEEIEEFDAIVIGAGVTGLYSLYRMRQLGFSVRAFDDGGGVGGLGIGTATLGPASTPRVTPTDIRSQRSSCRNGTGKSIIPASRRTSAT